MTRFVDIHLYYLCMYHYLGEYKPIVLILIFCFIFHVRLTENKLEPAAATLQFRMTYMLYD